MRLIREPKIVVPDNAEVTVHMTVGELRFVEAWLRIARGGSLAARLWQAAYMALFELGLVVEADREMTIARWLRPRRFPN